MMDSLHIMLWPLVACLLLPGILVYLGLHIVQRGIIFVDLALAQVAALGMCVAILMGFETDAWQAYAWSLGFTLVGAAVFTMTRSTNHRVPQEALIGIVYVVAAAAGILILSRNPEGNEELRRTLVGDVLLVQPDEVARTFFLFLVIGLVHVVFRKKFLAMSFEPTIQTSGYVRFWDFIFYALFGVVVTSFVQIGGVLLVFSYLIVPAVCAIYLAESFAARMVIGWVMATLGGLGGLYVSCAGDFPTGAAIVCTLGAILLLTVITTHFRKRQCGR
jgi:zinc/manganese transport system permease protein